MTNDAKHLFICLFDILLSSLVKSLFKCFGHVYWAFWLFTDCNSSLNILFTILLSNIVLQIFPPSTWLVFSFFKSAFRRANVLISKKSSYSSFFVCFIICAFCVLFKIQNLWSLRYSLSLLLKRYN